MIENQHHGTIFHFYIFYQIKENWEILIFFDKNIYV